MDQIQKILHIHHCMPFHRITRLKFSVSMIYTDDPLWHGVEEKDLVGVFLFYGSELQLFTADAQFVLILVGASGHASMLFLGVDEVSDPPCFDMHTGCSVFDDPTAVNRNKGQDADLVPLVTDGYVIIGVTFVPEYDVSFKAEKMSYISG